MLPLGSFPSPQEKLPRFSDHENEQQSDESEAENRGKDGEEGSDNRSDQLQGGDHGVPGAARRE
jgi:hypothetical protein